jgi:inosine/xanthosine triphosphatase
MPALVVVASQNPVKIEATRQGFRQMFAHQSYRFAGVAVASGVADQPLSRAETLAGARNRARNAQAAMPSAHYSVGIEGGVEAVDDQLEVFAWVVVQSAMAQGRAQTGVFYLPQEVARRVRDGMELGHADDAVFGRENSKQQSGSIGILTDDVLTRTDYYVQAVIMALIPFKQAHLSWGNVCS